MSSGEKNIKIIKVRISAKLDIRFNRTESEKRCKNSDTVRSKFEESSKVLLYNSVKIEKNGPQKTINRILYKIRPKKL